MPKMTKSNSENAEKEAELLARVRAEGSIDYPPFMDNIINGLIRRRELRYESQKLMIDTPQDYENRIADAKRQFERRRAEKLAALARIMIRAVHADAAENFVREFCGEWLDDGVNHSAINEEIEVMRKGAQ